MRRLLLLITDLKIGGTPTVVRELAARLHDPPGVQVQVACLDRWGPVADQIRDRGIPVTALNASGPGDVMAIARLIRLVRDQQIDTIISFLIHANAAASAAVFFCNGVRLFQSIQTTQAEPAWHWTLQRLIHPFADAIIVPSPSVAAAAQERSNIPRSKLIVIPNAIDPADFAGLGRAPAAGPLHPIGFIGRLDPVKRVPDLLQAVRLLTTPPTPALRYSEEPGHSPSEQGSQPLVHLHIFGDGSERARIENEIQQLNLEQHVTLHGTIARPQEALQQIELLVLPSQAEGFGLVLIEAMAAGVPIVATDAPGIRDVVRNGQTGVLVPVGSPLSLAAAIGRVIGDQTLREYLIGQGLTDVRERFAWESVIDRYRATFKLSRGMSPSPGIPGEGRGEGDS
jgi:glycosyltransferase involved in cell wall biosynthesis